MAEVILGINGYSKRVHDAAACLIVDGNVVAMAEEERFTRRKNAFGQVPHNAIAYCLEQAGLSVDDVNTVAVGWDFNAVFDNIGKEGPTDEQLLDLYLPADKFKYTRRPSLAVVPHHLAHAASAYYLSGFDESLVFVVDGQGESQATSVYQAKGKDLSLVTQLPVKDSLGYFYEAASEFVGLSRLDAGKTMGLASYGEPRYSFDAITLTDNGYAMTIEHPQQTEMDLQQEVTKAWTTYLEEQFGQPNEPVVVYDASKARFSKKTQFPQHYMDLAASAQKTLEDTVRHMVDVYTRRDKPSNLCIAGGVGLNCSMNGVIAREGQVQELFVPPFAGDAGVAVGAALYVAEKKPSTPLTSAALGPEFSQEVINATLDTYGIEYTLVDDISTEVAKLVADNKVVDWFQGRMEAGPRALGNRSIIGNPTRRDTHERLNNIKNREQWRPLAPSFLAEKLPEYMTDASDSPFMLRAFHVRPEMRDKIPAAVHIDGTSRAQTVTQEANPLYYKMIQEFEKLTGIPAVMNTSFNLEDEPIVCSPRDAIRTFFSSGADYLAIGNALVAKKK